MSSSPNLPPALIDDMARNGYSIEKLTASGGGFLRFPVNGDRNGKTAGWLKLFPGDEGAIYGDFKSGADFCWRGSREAQESAAERTARRERIEVARREARAELDRLRAAARAKAQKLWAAAGPVRADFPYVAAKRIRPFEARQVRDQLIVPLFIDGEMTSLQFIAADGTKKFLTDGEVRGGYFMIESEPADTLCVVEGYATGCSVHEATGHAVAICFNAGNLEPAARALRATRPEAKFVVCADNDISTKGNPGMTQARRAAQAVDALLAVPEFGDADLNDQPTDFNDLHRLEGLDAVKRAVAAAEKPTKAINAAPKIDTERSPGRDASKSKTPDWEPPILFGRSELPEISPDLLPGIFGEYAAALAASLQVSPTMPALYMLAVLSMSLQRKYLVSPFGDDYAEPVCTWVAILADSGERKSAVIQRLIAPALLWEAKRKAAMESDIAEVETLRAINQRRIEKLQTDAAKEDSPVRRGELAREIAELRGQTPEPKLAPRLFTGDCTPERLQQMLPEYGGRMAVMTDEGGIFSVMAGIYSGGESYLDVFLQGYSGSPVRVDRGARTAIIDRPALTFGIAIQPGLIQDMQPTAKRKFRSSGLYARFFWALPASSIGRRDMGRRSVEAADLVKNYRAAVLGLLDIEPGTNAEGEEVEHVLTLTEAARTDWIAFAQKVENSQAEGGKFESSRDWLAKLPGGALRVAGLLHIAAHGHGHREIDGESMQRAITICSRLVAHAAAVFDIVGAEPALEDAKICWRWIERQRALEFSRNEIHRAYHNRFAKVERLVRALEILKERSLIAGPHKGQATGGRPPIMYRVNPAALRMS